jgi:transposase
MDERLRFIARLLEGEKMAPLCREFGISRVTGYKIYNRYKDCGLQGLNDRSRVPYRQANRLPYQVERTILACFIHESCSDSAHSLPIVASRHFGGFQRRNVRRLSLFLSAGF